MRIWQRIFVDHPKSVAQTYIQHMCVAGWFFSRLLAASCAALIHAMIPCLFEKTAGRMIEEMYARITPRN